MVSSSCSQALLACVHVCACVHVSAGAPHAHTQPPCLATCIHCNSLVSHPRCHINSLTGFRCLSLATEIAAANPAARVLVVVADVRSGLQVRGVL